MGRFDRPVPPVTPDTLLLTRRRLGLSQAQLAARFDCNRLTISRWETGAEPISHPGMLALALERLEDTMQTGYPTDGETFFYRNETEPLVSLGRLGEGQGAHVLRRPDGSLIAVGGYQLRRRGETWSDMLAEVGE